MKSQDFWPPRSPYETTKRQGRWIWADFFDRFLSLKLDKMQQCCISLISFGFKNMKNLIKCYSFWKLKSRLLCRTTIQKNMFKVLKFSWNHKIWGIHVLPYETTKRQGRWIWADFFDRFLSLKLNKMHNKCKDLYLKEPLLKPSLELWKIGSRLYRQLSWRPKAHFFAFRSLYTRDTKKTCKPAENSIFPPRPKMPPRGRLCRLYRISTHSDLRE